MNLARHDLEEAGACVTALVRLARAEPPPDDDLEAERTEVGALLVAEFFHAIRSFLKG